MGFGHSDDNGGYWGPAHASCNRRAGAYLVNGRGKVDLDEYQDDPATNTFWGPPNEETGVPIRWSRAWYDWRSD